MKFLFVVTDFDMGGITTSLKNLSDELIKRGHNVSILNLPGNIDFPVKFHSDIEFITINGKANKWNIGMGDFRKSRGLYKVYLFILGALKKILMKLGVWGKYIFSNTPKIVCDIAIAYRQSSICYYILNHKTTAKKTIAFIHSELDGDCSSWIQPLKKIDCIACVSDDWSKQFRHKFPCLAKKVNTVYNLFDDKDIRNKSMEFEPEYDANVFNIVTVARIECTQKKIDTIPLICEKLKNKTLKNFKWYIVGNGPDINIIEEEIKKYQVEKYVELVGAQKNPYPYIKKADLFVLTSRWESYGMVVQEALILGTPVVAADYPALHEIISDNREGIIVENSIEGITNGIKNVLDDKQIHNRMRNYLEGYEYSSELAYSQLMKICE